MTGYVGANAGNDFMLNRFRRRIDLKTNLLCTNHCVLLVRRLYALAAIGVLRAHSVQGSVHTGIYSPEMRVFDPLQFRCPAEELFPDAVCDDHELRRAHVLAAQAQSTVDVVDVVG